jgi:hypothetical protein
MPLPRILGAIILFGMLRPAAHAQQPPNPEQPASQPQSGTGDDNNRNMSKEEQSGTSKDRLFYTLPNFLTIESKNAPPLTAGQKFRVVAKSSFDYIQIPWYAFLAGVGQAENSEPGFGQGAAGYGKRFGAAFADGTIENFLTGAIFPSLLHQDPRYFQSGKGSFLHRTAYAVSRMVVTRSDVGHAQFNCSEIVGSALSAGISTFSYHPSTDHSFPNVTRVWRTQLGFDTLTLVLKEFWPDIRRKLAGKS